MKNLVVIFAVISLGCAFGQQRRTDSLPGTFSSADRKKMDRIEIVSNADELRNLGSRRTDVTYRLINPQLKNLSDLYWDPNSSLPDDSVMVFKIPNVTTGRYLRYYEEIYAEWFGAIPDDGADDSYAFQKAINFAVKYSKSAKVKCGGGIFNVKNLVISNYENGSANYVAFALEGVAPSYDAASVHARMTEFYTNDGQAFTIAIQKGLNVLIKNIALCGCAPIPPSYSQIIEWTDADWNKHGAIRDNAVSPHAGIVIDGFYNSVTGANRYPGAINYYSNANRVGSSMVTIDGCTIRNYNVGIMISPAPGVTNGDNIVFQNGGQAGNKVFWASGQTQSRSNAIINLYSFGASQSLIDCRTYGANTGTPPSVLNSSLAGGFKYLYYTYTNFGSLKFINTYTESLWSLGKATGEFPVVFTDCDINLVTEFSFQSPVLAEGGPIHFEGGYISYFDNVYQRGLAFKNSSVSFNGTTLEGGVPISFITPHGYQTSVSFDNVIYSSLSRNSILKKGMVEDADASYEHCYMIPEMTAKGVYGIMYHTNDSYINETSIETAKLTTDASTHTAWFTSATPKAYGIGDCLETRENVDYANDIYTTSGTVLGWVSAISNNKITLSYAPYGINPATAYSIINARIQKFIPRVLGNVSKGSDVITNLVTSGGRLPLAGEFIKGTGIPPNARVLSAAPDKIVISLAATETASFVELYDAKMIATGTRGDELSYPQPFWYFGDRIINADATHPDIDYIRIKTAGVVGSSHPPTYAIIRN